MKNIFILILICISGMAYSQTQKYVLPYELANIKQIPLQQPLPDLTNLEYLDLTSILATLQSDLVSQNDALAVFKNLQQKFQPMGNDLQNIAFYDKADSLRLLKTSYETAMVVLSSSLRTINSNIVQINSGMTKINRTINDRMNSQKAQQEFRKWTSFIFAALLAIIICCFFFILFKNNSHEAASSLMGESGLQFITLFSIIISIILFGVLNILEGKELAAILSAIAGFILGKYNPGKAVNSPPPNPPNQ